MPKPEKEEPDSEDEIMINLYKLIRTQQFIACRNSITGPRAPPLPAQIYPKKYFKMKLSTVREVFECGLSFFQLYAGVRLNVDQNCDLRLGQINEIVEKVNDHIPANSGELEIFFRFFF